jgi:hypothetical protein
MIGDWVVPRGRPRDRADAPSGKAAHPEQGVGDALGPALLSDACQQGVAGIGVSVVRVFGTTGWVN